MEDYENVLESNFTKEQIDYINKNFTYHMVKDALLRKMEIDYEESINAVIQCRLLENYKNEGR